ncbi:oxidoreductase family, NAD-binding rossmann fold domain-containing protein [Sarocladium implicatum]|nr:oxidoreductase family, NAD-binding rossmann fold domain-containing protein [Sarocladium implicatum]
MAQQDKTPLRWAILGTSFISHTVVSAIQSSPSSTVVSVFGRDQARLTSFADKFNIPVRHSTSIGDLLDDATAPVDVVYVGLPSHLHAEATIAAAKRGKAILSEKSLATTMKDSEEMIKAVREAGVFFMEGLMYRCHPLITKIGEILKAGTLGDVLSIEGHYSSNIWKKANPLGKGTIYNLGCYPVSLLQFVMECTNGAASFTAAGRKVSGLGNVATDGGVRHVRDAALVMRFANGTLATIQSSDSHGKSFSFTVQGSQGTLRCITNPWLPSAGEDNVVEVTKKSGETERIVVKGEWDAFGYQVRRVEEGIRGGKVEGEWPAAGWQTSIDIMGLLLDWEEDILRQ